MVLAERVAYDALGGLKPWELGDLAPAELNAMVRGARAREDRQVQLIAWQTAHLLNISGKSTRQKITVAKLLGRRVGGTNEDTE